MEKGCIFASAFAGGYGKREREEIETDGKEEIACVPRGWKL